MSYKILFVTPHLSTGGCPQYLLKKIQLLKDIHQVYCVEYNDYGEWFNVQKTQVRETLGSNYFVLKENKHELLDIIEKVNPDIIHLEEMSEYFMAHDVAKRIYVNSRKYFVIETSHDSSFNIASKRFFPDRFVFVSEYQKRALSSLNIPSHVVEYPILKKSRATNRNEKLIEMGLDPNLFHVVNVGLFSPRKNQSEIFEYAKKMVGEPIQFHFVGNTAGNFQHYWEPLLKNVPSNCKIWGERKDVDRFYECMDLFLFTSRGHDNDKETSPIVIRESISYQIPALIYNLPVYLNMYDKYKNISYLDNDLNNNVDKIRSYLKKNDLIPLKSLFSYVISTYPNTNVTEDTTVQCLNALKNDYTILTTHYKDNYKKFESIANSVVFDINNPIIKHTFYSSYWYNGSNFKCDLNLRANGNDNYHGLAVWTNYQNGIKKSKELGFKYSVCINYDIVLDNKDKIVIENIIQSLETSNSKGYFIHEKKSEGDTLKTVFFVIDNDYFLSKFDDVKNESEYNASIVKHGSPSNSLENYVYYCLKSHLSDLQLTTQTEDQLFPNSNLNSFSCVEYFSVVPNDNKTKFVIWKSSSNTNDNKNIFIDVFENTIPIQKIGYLQSDPHCFYHTVNLKAGSSYVVSLCEQNSNKELINENVIEFDSISKIENSGLFKILNYNVPPYIKTSSKFNFHHFGHSKQSMNSLSDLIKFNVVYRSYRISDEIEVFNTATDNSHESHVLFKDVVLMGLPDECMCIIKKAREYMYDNNLILMSLNSDGSNNAVGGDVNDFSNFYSSTKNGVLSGYIINNNYFSKFKTISSLSDLNSYLKGYCLKSVIKSL